MVDWLKNYKILKSTEHNTALSVTSINLKLCLFQMGIDAVKLPHFTVELVMTLNIVHGITFLTQNKVKMSII